MCRFAYEGSEAFDAGHLSCELAVEAVEWRGVVVCGVCREANVSKRERRMVWVDAEDCGEQVAVAVNDRQRAKCEQDMGD